MKNIEVLLIEPVTILELAMRLNMERRGWKVDTASNALSGLEKAIHKHFDLILVEISQDDKMDGFGLIEKIKKQAEVNKVTPLCTITVHDIPENVEKARALGVDAFFEGVFLPNVINDINDYMETKQ